MCGMTRIEDVHHAVSLGVDAIGMIFYPKSPRHISIAQAKKLTQDLPGFVDAVAVVVNPEKEFVEDIIAELPIQFIQFHGEESPEFCEQFAKPFIKVIQPMSTDHIQHSVKEYAAAQALLFDTPSNQKGGTGQSFNWRLIPKNLSKPYFLAGGLNESNILQALQSCNPYAVDINSGVESLPGIKDPLKMSRFMQVLGEYNE